MEENPAVKAAKALKRESEILTLSTGVRVQLRPVGVGLIRDAVTHVKEPEIPKVYDETKGREIENPTDPAYLAALEETRRKREEAGLDALMLFGAELVDGLPEDETWLERLRYLEKKGYLDLSGFDLEDPLDREMLYKKYVAFGSQDLVALATASGIGREEVQAAIDSFRGPEMGSAD